MKRSRIAIAGTMAIFVGLPLSCILTSPYYRAQFSPVQHHLYSRDGFYLVRYSRSSIWLTWNFESGVNISPEADLRWFNLLSFKNHELDEDDLKIYKLTPIANTWMLDFREYGGTPMTYASLINPKNHRAEGDIRAITRLASQDPKDFAAISKLAARHFIFLGWTIENEAQAKALHDALGANWNLDRSRPIQTQTGTLHPVTRALVHKLEAPAEEATRIESASKTIPILLENVDSREGHPCDSMHVLFLDGHVDDIPFGSRFPATQGFLDAIRFSS